MAEIIPFPIERCRPPGWLDRLCAGIAALQAEQPPTPQEAVGLAAIADRYEGVGFSARYRWTDGRGNFTPLSELIAHEDRPLPTTWSPGQPDPTTA